MLPLPHVTPRNPATIRHLLTCPAHGRVNASKAGNAGDTLFHLHDDVASSSSGTSSLPLHVRSRFKFITCLTIACQRLIGFPARPPISHVAAKLQTSFFWPKGKGKESKQSAAAE